MNTKIESHSDALAYLYGGKAIFTLKSLRTGDHLTFKVRKKKDDLYYVSVLSSGYEYLGTIQQRRFFPSKKHGINLDFLPARALKWTVDHLESGKMPSELEFHHDGRCAKCRRRLTDPTSLKRGIGPDCATRD